MMSPNLSHRLAPVRAFAPFREMELDVWNAFVDRAELAETFEDMSAEDQALVEAAEANMPEILRNRWIEIDPGR